MNDRMKKEHRRVPIENMIYVADGPSDVPVFSVLRQSGGKTLAVYHPDSAREFSQVIGLQDQERVDAFGPRGLQRRLAHDPLP